MTLKLRDEYDRLGVSGYYIQKADEYFNPHEQDIMSCLHDIEIGQFDWILDVGCGNGLVTKVLNNGTRYFVGIDKFMAERYRQETKFFCYERDLTVPTCVDIGEHFDLAIISYVIDLLPKSVVPGLIWSILQKADRLAIIRPNGHQLNLNWLDVVKVGRHGKSRYEVVKLKQES